MTVQELFTKWGFDIDAKPLQMLEKNVGSLAMKINAVGLIATAAAGTMFGFAKFTADAGDEALHTAEMLGLNVENLQKLQFAAKLANVEHGELAVGLRFLSKNLIEAKKGSGDAAEAFKRIGLNPRQFANSEQALRAISDRFQKMPDGPERAALAMQLFGRSGANMVPFLKQGSAAIDEAAAKAEKYGIVLTEAQAQAADKFNDTLDETRAAMTGVRNVLGNALIPQIQRLLEAFNDYMAENRKVLAQRVEKFFSVLSRVIEIVVKAGQGAVEIFNDLTSVFGGMGSVIEYVNKALDFVLANPAFIKILGATVVAAYGLAAAFGAVNLAALAIPLAIAGIIGIIALLVDDFVAFSQGRDSAIGLLLNFFKNEFPNAFKFFSGILDGVVGMFKIFYNSLSLTLKVLYDIGSFIVGGLVSAFQKLGSVIAFIVDKLGLAKHFGEAGKLIGNATQGIGNSLAASASENGLIGSIGGYQPETSPVSGSNSNSTQNNNNQINLNLSVPPGANQSDISSAAKTGVMDGLDSILRQSNRSLKQGVSY